MKYKILKIVFIFVASNFYGQVKVNEVPIIYEKESYDQIPGVNEGIKFFQERKFEQAYQYFKENSGDKNSSNYLINNFYLALSIYELAKVRMIKKETHDTEVLKFAIDALNIVITQSPQTIDAFIIKARVSHILGNTNDKITSYEEYVKFIPDSLEYRNKRKLIEACKNVGFYYQDKDVKKSTLMFEKARHLKESTRR